MSSSSAFDVIGASMGTNKMTPGKTAGVENMTPRRSFANITNIASSELRDRSNAASPSAKNIRRMMDQESRLLRKMVAEKESLLEIQGEQLKQAQSNLVLTVRRSSAVNNELIDYNKRLQQEVYQSKETVTLLHQKYTKDLAVSRAIQKDLEGKVTQLMDKNSKLKEENKLLKEKEEIQESASTNVPQALSQNVPQALSQNMPQASSQNVPKSATLDVNNDAQTGKFLGDLNSLSFICPPTRGPRSSLDLRKSTLQAKELHLPTNTLESNDKWTAPAIVSNLESIRAAMPLLEEETEEEDGESTEELSRDFTGLSDKTRAGKAARKSIANKKEEEDRIRQAEILSKDKQVCDKTGNNSLLKCLERQVKQEYSTIQSPSHTQVNNCSLAPKTAENENFYGCDESVTGLKNSKGQESGRIRANCNEKRLKGKTTVPWVLGRSCKSAKGTPNEGGCRKSVLIDLTTPTKTEQKDSTTDHHRVVSPWEEFLCQEGKLKQYHRMGLRKPPPLKESSSSGNGKESLVQALKPETETGTEEETSLQTNKRQSNNAFQNLTKEPADKEVSPAVLKKDNHEASSSSQPMSTNFPVFSVDEKPLRQPRRAAAAVVSYREPNLKGKMRRPW